MARKKRKRDESMFLTNYSFSLNTEEQIKVIGEQSSEQIQVYRLHDIFAEALETTDFKIVVIQVSGLRLPLIGFLKPKRKYAPVFDQRILTEKLLGKPSPGLPPPFMLAA